MKDISLYRFDESSRVHVYSGDYDVEHNGVDICGTRTNRPVTALPGNVSVERIKNYLKESTNYHLCYKCARVLVMMELAE